MSGAAEPVEGGRPGGKALVIILLAAALVVVALRMLCVPVGSFREGLARVSWGMDANSVREILGEPNFVCTAPAVDHVQLSISPDTARVRSALASATAERWVYARPRPTNPVARDARPDCRAPVMGTELGFDADGRLRWLVREAEQTPAEYDPALQR